MMAKHPNLADSFDESSVGRHAVLRYRLPAEGAASVDSTGAPVSVDGAACGVSGAVEDLLAVEEPLEIRLGGRRFTLTMRTPGHDRELVAGFLLSEGFIDSADEISEIRQPRDRRGVAEPNVIDVLLGAGAERLRDRLKRGFAIPSSCGLCGKTTIESIRRRLTQLDDASRLSCRALAAMGDRMREEQALFAATGALHAAALFDNDGRLVVVREDIGRHNAVDKVAGYALLAHLTPLRGHVMIVSGRLSFEIAQKAAAAGVPILAGVSAPSSLAVQLAEEVGLTLVGFLRDTGFNVYCCPERISA
jgi:FdhD protein